MSYPYVSLIRDDNGHGGRQIIQPGEYTVVRFSPVDGESSDWDGMHEEYPYDAGDPNGWAADDRSGLIRPSVPGVGILCANLHWAAGPYSELRDRFVRDPLGTMPDSTATDHRPPSPGMQCFTKFHTIKVDPGTPLCLKVYQNSGQPAELIHAQFKLTIMPD